jgi:hypothetical protein
VSRSRKTRRRLVSTGLCAASICAASLSAHALERITLRNGFSYDCTRHEAVDSSHVRLYLFSADGNSTGNYIDRPLDAIASVETLPDPPKIAPTTATTASAKPLTEILTAADIPDIIARAGAQRNIDVDLLAAVIHAESGGHIRAVSHAGAQGLMQLMPATAHKLGVQDAFRPDQNINGGAAYLDSLLKLYNDDLKLALAAYNAGPGAVARYHGIPPYRETQQYVRRVLNEFIRRKNAVKTTAIASR